MQKSQLNRLDPNKPKELAQFIDHTLLKPEADESAIDSLCQEALEYNFFSVCVNSTWVERASHNLEASDVKVCCVIGFPLGAQLTENKAKEVELTKALGAQEFDMVLNIGALKSGKLETVTQDISSVVRTSAPYPVKVILETCLLTETEIVTATRLAIKAGAHFIKTSTGFSKHGATEEAVQLMKNASNDEIQIKASGGIRTREDAIKYINLGAHRVGASASVEIVKGLPNADESNY